MKIWRCAMEVPNIAKRIGTIEIKKKVYIEDYVLSFLELFKSEEIKEGERIILYGKSYISPSEESYVIFGAAKKLTHETKENTEERNENIFNDYDEIGCLNIDIWKDTSSMYDGILIGDGMGGQPILGCYIFYEEQPLMGKYLGIYYKEEIRKRTQTQNSKRQMEEVKNPKKQAELIALSEDSFVEKALEESPIYSFIRAVVIIIFIIFCAIAVTTVNSFEKLQDFTNTAVHMNETMQQP